MATATETLTGREYRRVSSDKSGEGRSVDEQGWENAAAAEDHGIALGEPYEDTGSASRYQRKGRDGFDKLTDDLKNDTFGADVLILWESSRGSRKVGEWITLIELCEERGVKIFVTSQGNMYDPANGRDRKALIDDANDSGYESYKIRTRVKRSLDANLAAGKPNGQVPFGYMREPVWTTDRRGRKVTRSGPQLPDPATAVLVIELFRRIKSGHSFLSIERDWAARGVTNKSGRPFSAQHLRSMATRKAYIGIRVHYGEESEGDWPVIADFKGSPMTADAFVTLFKEVGKILADPARKTVKHGASPHEFTGALRCDVCGGPVKVDGRKTTGRYTCRDKGCVSIPKEAVDAVLTLDLIAFLSDPDVYRAITPEDGGAELDSVRAQLAAKRAELGELESAPRPSGARAKIAMLTMIEELEGEITELEDRETKLTPRPSPLAELFEYGPDIERRWKARPVEVRRQIATMVLSPELLGQPRVKQVAASASPAVEDRIAWATEVSES
ncbi:recombinase family protein [Streptomyces sp. NPDC101152]|uniref:recombinase family protein n=1 Tax=Streptomyces sp. NPDC101152 TaxID=3366116 RepID=UPI0037F88DC6